MNAMVFILALVLQAPAASVEGRIVREGTLEPVVRSNVLLTKVGGRLQDSLAVSTNDQGVFSIDDVPPGTYRLFAEHIDYVKSEYGQRSPNRPGSPITLAAGQKAGDITMALTRTGVITGRAVGRNGDPIRARVQALTRSYAQGKALLNVVAEGQTNDLGEYRLFGLAPGSYLVGVAPYGHQRLESGTLVGLNPPRIDTLISIADGHLSIDSLTQGGQFIDPEVLNGFANLPQYYSGTADPASARIVAVQPGAVVPGVDIQLLPVAQPRSAPVKIRGMVVDGSTGQFAETATVQLSTPENPFSMQSLSRSVSIKAEARGAFEIDRVDPGPYILLGSNATANSGMIPIEAGNSGIDGLRIVLNPRIALNGRISTDGPSENLDFTKMIVMLQAPSFSRQIVPRADGTFSAVNVMQNDYRIVLGGTVSKVYLKRARLGDTDVLDAGLSLSATPQQSLELVVSANTGTLDGTVLDGQRRPSTGVRVVLVPEGVRRKEFERYRAVSSDSAGKFRIEGIVPGGYKVFAWEDIDENAWQIPEILRPYEDRGRIVRVDEGGQESLELHMIPR